MLKPVLLVILVVESGSIRSGYIQASLSSITSSKITLYAAFVSSLSVVILDILYSLLNLLAPKSANVMT